MGTTGTTVGLTCELCAAALTGKQRRWCGPVCRQSGLAIAHADAYKLWRAGQSLVCRGCGSALTGRQMVWCSGACRRNYETQMSLEGDIATYARQCVKCGLVKPLAKEFYKTSTGTTYRRSCRSCVMAGNKTRNIEPDAAEKRRNYHLMSLYGITAVEYDAILVLQEGRCAVCRKSPTKMRLAVDHDHRSGLIRGLLCSHCNLRLIGRQTDVEALRHAVAYLEDPPARRAIGPHAVPSNRPRRKRKPRQRRKR